MADRQDEDFDTLMRGSGVKRLSPEGSASPVESKPPPKTVRRKAGEARALRPESAPAAPAVPDRSAEIAALEAKVKELEEALNTEKEGRAEDAAAAKRQADRMEGKFAAYASISQQIVPTCMNCPSAPGFPSVRVEPDDCEVCGGEDLRTSVRKFLDACLVNGRLKVCFVGHTAKAHALLRSAVQDRRVTLVQSAIGAEKTAEQARGDVKHADAVVLWMAEGLPDEIMSIYRTATRLEEISTGTVPAALQAATSLVTAD